MYRPALLKSDTPKLLGDVFIQRIAYNAVGTESDWVYSADTRSTLFTCVKF